MDREKRLKTVLFYLGDRWRKQAEELAAALRQAQIEVFFPERGWKYDGKCTEGMDPEQILVLTDCEETAQRLKKLSIACVGCAGPEHGYFKGTELVTGEPEALSAEELEEYLFHFHGWPVTVAVTERLILREIADGDVDRLCEISRQSCMRYLQDTVEKNFFRKENLLSYRKEAYRLQGYGLWSVLKKDGTLIGCCGLADVTAQDGQVRLELQYMLDEKYHRKGYGTEMCRAVLAYAFARTDQKEIWLRVHPENAASRALAGKLGFQVTTQSCGRCEKWMLHVLSKWFSG